MWSRLHAWRAGLPKPTPWRMRTLHIPMRDGVRLGADLYTPVAPAKGVLLVAGPYGRGPLWSVSLARAFAGQKYTVLFASTRGTADSEGDLDPMRTDAQDGHDIVTWMREQPWYPGRFGTIGGSYLGYTQWALMSEPPADLAAAVVTMGPHDFVRHTWGTGSFRFDLVGWGADVGVPDDPNPVRSMRARAATRKQVDSVVEAVPVAPAAVEYFTGLGRAWMLPRLIHDDIDDPFYAPMRHADALEHSRVPTLLFAGWQDIFLAQSMRQYERLRERGVDVALTVGDWAHIDILLRGQPVIASETLDWLDAHLAGQGRSSRRRPVRVAVGGSGRWLEERVWPPAGVATTTWYLHADGGLGERVPAPDAASRAFVFDPARPTPTIGGNLISKGGRRDDSAYGTRRDVLVYDSAPLRSDLWLSGVPRVSLDHASERGDADLFLRLSDIDEKGRSRNVTEAYRRVRDAGTADITLNDIAYVFRAGHRVRLIVAGGSFPQFSRNPGSGENPLVAEILHPNRHEIRHRGGSSVLLLPIMPRELVAGLRPSASRDRSREELR
ncbi:CocE/NonD family hydrolase [Nocardia aurantia]|nr:CocE/NonD family hydrolase [Nocardia aurantia]